eukprot:COSAG02_NODE_12305_length_1565_cov_1.403820_1_plen_130_part_00
MASASSIPNPVCPHSAAVPCSPLGCVKISGVSTKCPWSLTSLGSIASKFRAAIGRVVDGGPRVQLSLPAVVPFVHVVPGTNGLVSIDIVDRGVGVSATSIRGSGVLSMMMSGANIEIVNGGGRSQYTGV